MFFASDNGAGASRKVIDAMVEALGAGPALAYGRDSFTAAAERRIAELFERDVAVFMLTSGTATNALALAHVTPPWGAVFCHPESHTNASECGAPEFYGGGFKLIGVPGVAGKVTPDAVERALGTLWVGDPHSVQPGALSLTNLTECGTLYTPAEVGALAAVAHRHGMAVHMDGARFANAIAAAGCTPADMTWKAGVDVLSFGATKGGAIAAEAVVFFDPKRADGFAYRRMRGGHLLSKMRFVAAQFDAWLEGGHWLDLARHANAMARRLADALATEGVRTAWDVQGNEVFAILPAAFQKHMAETGARFIDWRRESLVPGRGPGPGDVVARLVCSFATREDEIAAFVAAYQSFRAASRAAE